MGSSVVLKDDLVRHNPQITMQITRRRHTNRTHTHTRASQPACCYGDGCPCHVACETVDRLKMAASRPLPFTCTPTHRSRSRILPHGNLQSRSSCGMAWPFLAHISAAYGRTGDPG